MINETDLNMLLKINEENEMNSKNLRMGKCPLEIQNEIQRLQQEGYIYTADGSIKLEDKLQSIYKCFLPFKLKKEISIPYRFIQYKESLPNPHILFYDWRFTEETLIYLIRLITVNDWCLKPNICFICCPHLGVLFHLLFPDIEITIIDNNFNILDICKAYVTDKVKVLNMDIRKPFPDYLNNQFSTIFFDPPLYYDYYVLLLEKANLLAIENGKIYMVLYNSNIRQDLSERYFIFKKIIDLKLNIKSIYENILYYEVPYFESKTYGELGITEVNDWRNHELVVLEKNKITHDSDEYINRKDYYEWKTFIIGKKTIMIRKSENINYGVPIFKSIYNDGGVILKSVSRRHKERKKVNFWTSDNEVYHVENVHVVEKILEKYKQLSANEIINEITGAYDLDENKARCEISPILNLLNEIVERK